MLARGTFFAMPTKPKSYKAELDRLAAIAFQQAARARDEARKAKVVARLATARARRIRTTARLIDKSIGEPGGSVGFRRAQAKIQHDWPFYLALARAKLSLPEWARRQVAPPVGEETARNWMKPSSPRKCPESWARRIHQQFPEVPVTDEAWPKGIAWGF